jgi:uroporphyrinogen decarboxylase
MPHPLTSRERLLLTLDGKLADRVPVSPFVQEQYLAWYYPHRTVLDRVIDAVDLANELDFDLMAKPLAFMRPHFFRKSRANWELRESESSDGRMHRFRLEIVTPRGVLSQEEAVEESGITTAGVMRVTTKHLLETREDIEIFLEYLPPLDDAERARMREVQAGWRPIVADRGVLAPWGFAGVFNFAAGLRGIETLFLDPGEDASLYGELMSRIAAAQCEHSTALAEAGADAIGIQGHMANAGTVSPAFFRKHVQEYETRVIEAIHAAGAFSVYHNCGRARRLYGNYREMGMSLWETVSEPPAGDNHLVEAKAVLGDKIALLGNLDQIHFLKTASPAEVAERTAAIMAVGKPGGRYIFAASDYLESGTPRENVIAMLDAARQEGVY